MTSSTLKSIAAIGAVVLNLNVSDAVPGCGEPLSTEIIPQLREVGELCLQAAHRNDLDPAIAKLQQIWEHEIKVRPNTPDSVGQALSKFLFKWQDFLARREAGYSIEARGRLSHLTNLPAGYLLMDRSEMQRRFSEMPIKDVGPPEPPYNVTHYPLPDGTTAITWGNADDVDRNSIREQDDQTKEWRTIATVPPDAIVLFLPLPTGADRQIDDLVEHSVEMCFRARTTHELDSVLTELSRHRIMPHLAANPCYGRVYSKLNCALQFVSRWQDALAANIAGRRKQAGQIWQGLADANAAYELADRERILKRAAAAFAQSTSSQ